MAIRVGSELCEQVWRVPLGKTKQKAKKHLFAAHLGLLNRPHSMGYLNFTHQSANWRCQLFNVCFQVMFYMSLPETLHLGP